MKINEMTVGSSVEIKVYINGEELTFISSILSVVEKNIGAFNGVCIDLIKVDDKVIVFDSGHAFATITNILDNREYKYTLASITRQNVLGDDVLLLLSTDDSKAINHRDAVRVPLCEECELRIGQYREAVDAVTRDISCTGISFSFPSGNFNYKLGEEVQAKFYVGAKGPYNVSAVVVRDMQEGNRTILGCSFNRQYPIINQLVNRLQVKARIEQ